MKALFVVRHNNDFDSIAPVADGWARRSPAHESLVIVASPELAWRGDYRAAMLGRQPRVALTDLWEIAASRSAGAWLERAWRKVTPATRIRRKSLQLATELVAAPGYDAKFAALLQRWRPDIVAFDWYNVPAKRKRLGYFGYQAALAWAAAHRVPVVSLPHGLQLFDPPGAGPAVPDPRYALTFVESRRRKDRLIGAGTPAEKIAVCGSPRYDPSWVARIVAELEGEPAVERAPGGRVVVAFFATKCVYDFDFALLLAWLGELASHRRVDLVIQPHPRGQRAAVFAPLATFPNVAIDTKTPASTLIGRAHIVSTLVSSVMVEAVLRGREILYPKFVNTVPTRFEEKEACIGLERLEDTHAAIDAYLSGSRVPRANYDAFLKETVFGDGDADTIGRICARMMDIARKAAKD